MIVILCSNCLRSKFVFKMLCQNAYHSAIAKGGNWKQAVNMLDTEKSNSVQDKVDPHNLAVTLQSCAKAGQVDKMFELLQTADNQQFTNVIMNGIFVGLGDYAENNTLDVVEVGWKVLEVFRNKGVKLDSRGASALLSCVAHHKIPSEGKKAACAKVVEELSKDGNQPDVLCYAKLATHSPSDTDKQFWARTAAAAGELKFWVERGGHKQVDYHDVPLPFVKYENFFNTPETFLNFQKIKSWSKLKCFKKCC